ncbi:hypothetical protein ENUP19_0274G0059 [Entamoeba nuttalli]|uniref:Uncharacterized protein n=2 Tax=Entamoeba nuttalli TaxID=412467 RepID=K2GUA2_ENTNP|nr:hypothetical protein ENU1_197630 [Entamoeba nuttalli P19]EKE37437.1 hypothetical protein ENU1_197630 [Entamoeba nuttalli P19]|eukprot:XP_008860230.1 hypothetical protein ENU1_197630 [Entamoeba nuttalli P19]
MEEMGIDQNVNEILRLFEEELLDSSLKDFRDVIDGDLTIKELEDIVKQGITEEIPTVIDAAKQLIESNFERGDLLREAHIIGQQYQFLQQELKYYKELLNEPTNK